MLVAFVAAERRAAAPVIPLDLLATAAPAPLLVAAATGAFGLFAGALLLPRYFQTVRDVSATHSGLLIYPLLLGLVVAVNVGAAVIVRRLEFRAALLVGLAARRARRARLRDVRRVDARLAVARVHGAARPRRRADASRACRSRCSASVAPARDRRARWAR